MKCFRHSEVEGTKRMLSVLPLSLALLVTHPSWADQVTTTHTKMTLPDGAVYDGEIKDGLLNGKGVLLYKSGDRYEGNFKEGQLDGKGVFLDAKGNRYEGEYKEGQIHGKGVFLYKNGYRIEGEFKNGDLDGKGVVLDPNGDKYEGEFKDGLKNGTGIYIYAIGDRYEGEFRNGVYHGQGRLRCRDGAEIAGEFKSGLLNGKGMALNQNGERYEGKFENGKLEGKGIVYLPNGSRYEGKFKNGQPNGRGTYITPDGTRYAGAFKSRTDTTFERSTSHILPLLLIASVILNFVLLAVGGHPRNWYKPRLAKDQSPPCPDNLDNMERFEKIVVLESEAQAEALDVLLAERGVPHEMRSYHDSALDGIYQGSQGWGHVEAPKDRADEVLQALKDLSGPPADVNSA